jgi:hypothetical protein
MECIWATMEARVDGSCKMDTILEFAKGIIQSIVSFAILITEQRTVSVH